MARIPVDVTEVDVLGDRGYVAGLCITCTECDLSVTVFGRTDRSIRAGCAKLRDQCEQDAENFYATEDD